jgi:hypothetical protein
MQIKHHLAYESTNTIEYRGINSQFLIITQALDLPHIDYNIGMFTRFWKVLTGMIDRLFSINFKL